MSDWLIIATVIVVLWVLWLFMGFVADLFQTYFDLRAARKGEDMPTTKETERSS